MNFTKIVCALCLVLAATGPNTVLAGPPNVLLILTDDQGWGDLGAHGNDYIQTPNLDRLKSQSVSFDRFYVDPVCAPTRAALLTGLYAARTGAVDVTDGLEKMKPELRTIAHLFQKNGYRTACIGKWHNGLQYPYHPISKGFDEFFGFCAGGVANHFDAALEYSTPESLLKPNTLDADILPHQPIHGDLVQTEGYITDVLTDQAIQFLEKNRNRPFFCYLSYNAPHSPWQAPDRFFDKYKAMGLSDGVAGVYAMTESIDENMGRILKSLEDLKLAKKTILLFLSDNGPLLRQAERYNGGMKGGKGSCHEGGVRVPFFLRWGNRFPTGQTINTIAAHIDILPTLADLCGLELESFKDLDGVSLKPLLFDNDAEWPDRMLFTSRWRKGQFYQGSIRTNQYRYVHSVNGDELYDMLADPDQTTNLSISLPSITEALSTSFHTWNTQTSKEVSPPETVPVGNPEAVISLLPQHEGFKTEGIQYKAVHGYTTDYFVGWQSTDDYLWWNIDVQQAGKYQVQLLYQSPEEELGSNLRIEVENQMIQAVVTRPFNPGPLPTPDRVPRDAIPKETRWAVLDAGKVELSNGQTTLKIRATEIPGSQGLVVRGLRLIRMD